ncbi:hypothetical protein, partial [Chryseobacterium sp. CH25]|uniref:hypothetical protein n=1 Tax=Chryseobacterium sp. CH25 TaxID=713559 RepID=UPI001028702F
MSIKNQRENMQFYSNFSKLLVYSNGLIVAAEVKKSTAVCQSKISVRICSFTATSVNCWCT